MPQPIRTCVAALIVAATVSPAVATTTAPGASAPAASRATPTAEADGSTDASRAQAWTPRQALRELEVRRERRAGYDRDLFGSDWTDADGDCRDARDEVLAQESRETVPDGCDVTRGLWRSSYDGLWWRDSSDVDIDHVVALAEAWDSGARRWAGATRLRYANDLRDRRTLVAVTDNVNQSKGDQDPAEWLPERRVCRYVVHHLAVKVRWSLSVDRQERRVLRGYVDRCPDRAFTVRRVRT